MTSISSVSSAWSSASVQRAQRPGPSPERLLAKIDADGSGGVDATELQGLLDDVAKKAGVSSQASAADLVQQYDSDGDGSLNADELGKTMQSAMPPPPSTMAFAQSRSEGRTAATGQAGDDLFGKVDTDGDGGVGQTELQALLEKMSGGTASKTGVSSDELFSRLDADGDGSLSEAEFDAGRPAGEAGGGAVGGMPPPPPGGPGAPGGASASSSTSYDPLDTNEDGVVSASEQAAGAAQADAISTLFKTIDTDGDSSISSEEAQSFIRQLTSQFASATGSTESSARSESSSSGQTMDLMQLAQLARSQYEAAAGSWSRSTSGSTLSALA